MTQNKKIQRFRYVFVGFIYYNRNTTLQNSTNRRIYQNIRTDDFIGLSFVLYRNAILQISKHRKIQQHIRNTYKDGIRFCRFYVGILQYNNQTCVPHCFSG